MNVLPLTEEDLRALSQQIAEEYAVSHETMADIIDCESQWDPEAIGDSGNSYGLVQIFMPVWGDEISIEEATDPEWSLTFLAKNLSEGNGYLWTCYRKLYSL